MAACPLVLIIVVVVVMLCLTSRAFSMRNESLHSDSFQLAIICSSYALADINRLRAQGHDIRAAIASRTDEPHWARICLEHLVIEDGSTLQSCFRDPKLVEIGGGSKTGHIRRLHKSSGVKLEDMAFFDNESWNIKDVSKGLPAVECVYTPNGMTRDAWDRCKRKFGLPP